VQKRQGTEKNARSSGRCPLTRGKRCLAS